MSNEVNKSEIRQGYIGTRWASVICVDTCRYVFKYWNWVFSNEHIKKGFLYYRLLLMWLPLKGLNDLMEGFVNNISPILPIGFEVFVEGTATKFVPKPERERLWKEIEGAKSVPDWNRRVRGDINEGFKILNGLEADANELFTISGMITRDQSINIFMRRLITTLILLHSEIGRQPPRGECNQFYLKEYGCGC